MTGRCLIRSSADPSVRTPVLSAPSADMRYRSPEKWVEGKSKAKDALAAVEMEPPAPVLPSCPPIIKDVVRLLVVAWHGTSEVTRGQQPWAGSSVSEVLPWSSAAPQLCGLVWAEGTGSHCVAIMRHVEIGEGNDVMRGEVLVQESVATPSGGNQSTRVCV